MVIELYQKEFYNFYQYSIYEFQFLFQFFRYLSGKGSVA